MQLLNILKCSVFQILSLICVGAYLLGVLNIYFSDKNNYCVMTYMFEYPQFVRIALQENQAFPQYGLYAYSEGRLTERARKMWFDGVPVLFLPGNSGSHMQARSLASVALRKAMSDIYDYHFDFFTISFNEELSGLYGGVLQSQTQFAAACISRILSLYKSNKYTKSVPTSVILIGHSMGGLIAKRLLAYPQTVNTTNLAITLAAPLDAPVINFDGAMNDYYMQMNKEWSSINQNTLRSNKYVISVGSGPRDVLMPAGLTSTADNHINALTTSIPGVWVSPDHVCMVWCKQLVMVINRFLFEIVDPITDQISENKQLISAKAKKYFVANRTMTFDENADYANVTLSMDAFWYEDNRRVYQISRPEIDRTTYLMIRLVNFPQNRFVAVESINVDDRDWIFGCNAKYIHKTYRHCKEATSLSQFSRWTGAATDFGKRKLGTINLHKVKEHRPDWTHVVVKVSPTRKPIVLNVDINDHASRQINVQLPSPFSFGKQVIRQETEPNSLYYELVLEDFNAVHQAFLLYVEPTGTCEASQYHASAELHVPWAENHEYYHYFNHLKRSPMKLRLFKSNPNLTMNLEPTEKVKVTILLDPQCTFSISISHTWYYRLGQLSRNYTPILVPYVAAILLLAARSNFLNLKKNGTCISIHSSLMTDGVKPYYVLVSARFGAMATMMVPILHLLDENASWKNLELQYFTQSLLVLPVYMTALGILNIAVAAALAVMVFSSQIAHRLLFRIVWRGGSGLAERMAAGLQKVPLVASAALVCAAPLACGAASLLAGAAFYAFMLSKMYEEYLEDYVYKLVSKIASRICYVFKSRNVSEKSKHSKPNNLQAIDNVKDKFYESDLDKKENALKELDIEVKKTTSNNKEVKNNKTSSKSDEEINNKEIISKKCVEVKNKLTVSVNDKKVDNIATSSDKNEEVKTEETESESNEEIKNKDILSENNKKSKNNEKADIDEDLNNLNFHMMLFFLWMCVTIVNLPALLTWARNFKYSIILKPDTSYIPGLVMSACSTIIWQINGPRKNLKYYDAVCSLLFTMAVVILILGPYALSIVNYGITLIFTVITIQQLYDSEESSNITQERAIIKMEDKNVTCKDSQKGNNEKEESTKGEAFENVNPNRERDTKNPSENCDPCNENRIYSLFRNLRERFDFSENL